MHTMMASDADNGSEIVDDSAQHEPGINVDQNSTQEEQASSDFSEADLAEYLVETPDFFTRYGEVLAGVVIPNPNEGRAISLQERQLEVLRDKHRALEARLADLVRVGRENDEIADRLARFTRELLIVRDPAEMPARIEAALSDQFKVPQVVLRLWRVAPEFADQPFAAPVEAEVRRYFDELHAPYCGLKNDLAPIGWLPDKGAHARSVALLPLRSGVSPQASGLIVFGSPDADRFQKGMGTAFLDRIAEVASAALARLMPQDKAVDATQT